MPKRIQMTRQKPWRADHPDAVIVARHPACAPDMRMETLVLPLLAAEIEGEVH